MSEDLQHGNTEERLARLEARMRELEAKLEASITQGAAAKPAAAKYAPPLSDEKPIAPKALHIRKLRNGVFLADDEPVASKAPVPSAPAVPPQPFADAIPAEIIPDAEIVGPEPQRDMKAILAKSQMAQTAGTAAPPALPTEAPVRRPEPPREIEAILGMSWMSRIGAVILILGVGFFFKYAYDQGWVSQWIWVALGIVAGFAMCGGGEWAERKKYEALSRALTGVGIGFLYLSIFAASHNFWNLLPSTATFGLMCAVTFGAALLSLRYDSRVMAVIGIIGGYFTPIVLSTGENRQVALFTYLLVLGAGVVVLYAKKRWAFLKLASFAMTFVIFAGWYAKYYDTAPQFGSTMLFLTLFFILFTVFGVLASALRGWEPGVSEFMILILNALLCFAFAQNMMRGTEWEWAKGWHVAALGLAHWALCWFVFSKAGTARLMELLFGIGAVLMFIFAPTQFDGANITHGWTVLGALLIGIYLAAPMKTAAVFGGLTLMISAGKLLTYDSFYLRFHDEMSPWLNAVAGCYMGGIAALAAIAFGARRVMEIEKARPTVTEGKPPLLQRSMGVLEALPYIAWIAGLSLLFMGVGLEIFAHLHRAFGGGSTFSGEPFQSALLFTTVWGLMFSTCVFGAGVATRRRFWFFAGCGFLALTVLKMVCCDLYLCGELYSADKKLLLEFYCAAVALLLWTGAGLCSRARTEKDARYVLSGLFVAGTLYAGAFWWLLWPDHGAIFAWTAMGSAIFFLSARTGFETGIATGIGVLLVAGVRLLLYNMGELRFEQPMEHFLNPVFGEFLALCAASGLCAKYLLRLGREYKPAFGQAAHFMALAACFFFGMGLTVELPICFTTVRDFGDHLANPRSSGIVSLWNGVYAVMLVAAGLGLRYRPMRLFGLGLMALVVAKIFIYDIWHIERVYRIIAFVCLGSVLMTGSFLYHRFKDRLRQFVVND